MSLYYSLYFKSLTESTSRLTDEHAYTSKLFQFLFLFSNLFPELRMLIHQVHQVHQVTHKESWCWSDLCKVHTQTCTCVLARNASERTSLKNENKSVCFKVTLICWWTQWGKGLATPATLCVQTPTHSHFFYGGDSLQLLDKHRRSYTLTHGVVVSYFITRPSNAWHTLYAVKEHRRRCVAHCTHSLHTSRIFMCASILYTSRCGCCSIQHIHRARAFFLYINVICIMRENQCWCMWKHSRSRLHPKQRTWNCGMDYYIYIYGIQRDSCVRVVRFARWTRGKSFDGVRCAVHS